MRIYIYIYTYIYIYYIYIYISKKYVSSIPEDGSNGER